MTTHTFTHTTTDAHSNSTEAEAIGAQPQHETSADLAAALHEAARRLSLPPQQGESSDDLAGQAAAVVRRFLTSLERGDLASVEDLICDDLIYRIPGRSRISGVYEGMDGITAACSIAPRPGAKELQSELTDLLPTTSGEDVATFHTLTGRLDGHSLDIDIALRFRLRDGRIAVITEYSTDQYTADDLFAESKPEE